MIKAPAEVAEDPMAEEIVMIPNPEPHSGTIAHN